MYRKLQIERMIPRNQGILSQNQGTVQLIRCEGSIGNEGSIGCEGSIRREESIGREGS